MSLQIAELKDKVERISVSKEKDPVINFHVTEYVLKPTNSTSSKHTLFAENDDPRSHLSESIRVAQRNRYNKEKKKSRGFGNYRSSHRDRNRNIGHATTNQLGNSNTVGAIDKKVRREFTNLGRSLSTVMRSWTENGVLSKLPINPARPIRGRFVNQSCEYHQCKGIVVSGSSMTYKI
ncbi:hypothetical protein JCGZ_06452 [Jatropha curcas]|uniref:Uncharacterized protein n=1 Tax=Jatropha curcas TaxID=180498 RepID=A0A067KS29_JATCU|nr:hypothetical protein JCGZ_06452 [Jatropha curcas]